MPFSIDEFWKLAVESRLFAPKECQRLTGAFAQIKGAMETGNAFTLSEWLIAQRVLTRYQAKVLLARRAGPFVYGDYKITERIDNGRLQGLFRAVHGPTKQPVVLAFLSGPHLQDPQALPRLRQVLGQSATVRHPHVARLYHLVDLEAFKFCVLSDLQGRSLEEYLAARKPYSPADACRLARQAALGLAEIHKGGQSHGDVRPANLWQDPAGKLKLLYLPLSRDPLGPPIAAALASGIADPALQSAADYLAPELTTVGRRPEHPGSDLYALGCTLYYLLVGHPPFADGDVAGKLRRHAQEQPPPPHQINPQVPPPVSQVVAYMMAKDPGARYQQAVHVAEALAPYIDPAAREPVSETISATGRAYEAWLDQQQPSQARTATVPSVVPQARVVPPVAPMAQPVYAGHSPMHGVPAMATPVGRIPAATLAPPPTAPAMVMPDFATRPSMGANAAGATSSGPSLATQRKARHKTDSRNKLIIGSGTALLAVIVAFLVFSGSRKRPEVTTAPPITAAPQANPAANPASNPANGTPPAVTPTTAEPAGPPEEPLASVDGDPLWESPTTGSPLDLRYLPATQMYLAIRPAEIWAHPEGRQVLASLGIEEILRQNIQRYAGTAPDNLEQLILGFMSRGTDQPPAIALVARTIQPVEEDAAQEIWNAQEEIEIEGQTLFKGEGYTYCMPEAGQGKLLIALPITDATELSAWVAGSKNPPLLRPPKLELLARASDSRRHVTLLAAPGFLFGEGRGALVGTLGPLASLVQPFLIDDAGQTPAGAMLSLHLSSWLFAELRLTSEAGANPTDLAKLYRTRVQGLKEAAEKFCIELELSPYSRPILMLRYPGFFDFVAENTRAGTNPTEKHVVLRSALPTVAASNLAFGTHLAMLESGGGGVAMTNVSAAPAASAGPQTLADKLNQKYTLAFDRDSLDRTIDLISKDTGIPMKIDGDALKLEGITKNQSFGLDEKDKPLGEVLKTIMIKSNPAGKLVYVFEKIDGQEGLKITTRAAAGKNIPPELK